MTDRATAIRSLIAAQPPLPGGATGYLQRVCLTAAQTLSASGTGISVLTDSGARGVCAASDPHSERIDELQFVLGEGPCIDAFDTRRPVLIDDLAAEAAARWPMYTPAARDSGVRAVFAFPLQVGSARLGVLDVYREHVGSLADDQLRDALTFADIIVGALLGQQEDADAPGLADEMQPSAEVFQAQGMVMVQIEGTIGDAIARMRAYAYAEGRSLGDIARDVVARKLTFDRDRP